VVLAAAYAAYASLRSSRRLASGHFWAARGARSVVGSGPRFARPEARRAGASLVRDRDLAALVSRAAG